jgi:cytoskeletal protein CcmA (bactofilin family)
MLFRRQNTPTTAVNTQTPSVDTKPLTATRSQDQNGPVRAASPNATPTAPIAQAQQRRVVTSPTGHYSMPSSSNSSATGNRKLQVGRDITLQGEIGACDHLVIEGTVKATIKQLQQFDILDYGLFSGSVTAENADINGTFDGDLTISGRLWLRAGAKVTGTIRYGSLQVEKGAILKGTLDSLESVVAVKTPVSGTNSTAAHFAANDQTATEVLQAS